MRKIKIVRSRASKKHMSKFEQLQQIKIMTKTIVSNFQQQKIVTKKHK